MNELEVSLPSQYSPILDKVNAVLPLARLDSQNFYKASSQFKVATLDVVDLTPINSAKHFLAIIQQTRVALEEGNIKIRRKRLELEKKERELMSAQGDEMDSLLIDIDELRMGIANIEDAAGGAVRRIANALDQYENILSSLGKEHLTELDYEKDEIRYHIMTAFNQALTSARAKGGIIDEGNHIYLFQLGINGAVAQAEVTAFLQAEQEELNQNKAPSHNAIIVWLNLLADRFEKAPETYAAHRNMQILNESILLQLEGR